MAAEAEVKGDGVPAEGEAMEEEEEEEEAEVTTVPRIGEASIKDGGHTGVTLVGHSMLQRPQQRGPLQVSPCQCT